MASEVVATVMTRTMTCCNAAFAIELVGLSLFTCVAWYLVTLAKQAGFRNRGIPTPLHSHDSEFASDFTLMID